MNVKDVWNGPVGKAIRQVYVAAIAAGLMAAWDSLFRLNVDQTQWAWWAGFLAIVKLFDALIRGAIARWADGQLEDIST